VDDEFGLIDAIVAGLGDRGAGDWITVGPGDDAALIQATPGMHQVASIDSLLADVHFPLSAPPQLIGYRALMVAFSDLAAMAATPRYCLVSLSIDAVQLALGSGWVVALAQGMAEAAAVLGVYVCGGNLSRGPLNIGVSVHGEVDRQRVLLRSGGAAGHGLYVTGPLGGAAACVRTRQMVPADPKALTPLQQAYYRPLARCDLAADLGLVAAGMDISDGLAQDLGHLCRASGCGAALDSSAIPVAPQATLDDALFGGDDYQLLLASEHPIPNAQRVGYLTHGAAVTLDGEALAPQGYNHFRQGD
jgi:thiamine-monophosphate kinase